MCVLFRWGNYSFSSLYLSLPPSRSLNSFSEWKHLYICFTYLLVYSFETDLIEEKGRMKPYASSKARIKHTVAELIDNYKK